MKIFSLSDPHLSFASNKPMSVFGPRWQNHAETIRANWTDIVTDEDLVVIAGDISWAMRLNEALPDLEFLDRLPGRKVLLRGNHDYWWSTVGKLEMFVRDAGLLSLSFLRYEAFQAAKGVWLAGSRGWLHQTESQDWAVDEPIYQRELIRFDLALRDAATRMQPDDTLIAVSHFSPLDRAGNSTPLSERIQASGAALCIHGHVHNANDRPIIAKGVTYVNTAADVLKFRPLLLHDGQRLVYNA